jgi:hypothetical protein
VRDYFRIHIVQFALFLACLSFPMTAIGAEFRVRPTIILEQEYSDNFYLSEYDEVGVWRTGIKPGVHVEGLTGRSRFNLRYFMPYYLHSGSKGLIDSSRDDYLGHDLSFSAATRPTKRLTVGVLDDYILTREPTSADQLSAEVDRSKYWLNRVEPFIVYDIAEKGEIRLAYRYGALNYLERRFLEDNAFENRGIMTLTYHLNSSNHLDLDNNYWTYRYDGVNSDYTAFQSELIYRRDFNTFMTGYIGGGYQWRSYDAEYLDDQNGFIFDMGLNGATDLSRLDLQLQYRPVDFTQYDDYFSAFRADLRFERFLLQAFWGYLGGYYQFSDYDERDREDNSWEGFVGARYPFFRERMELGLEYNHRERDSTEVGRDYQENRLFFRLSAFWDFGNKE